MKCASICILCKTLAATPLCFGSPEFHPQRSSTSTGCFAYNVPPFFFMSALQIELLCDCDRHSLVSVQVCLLRAVRLQLAGLPLRVAEQLHSLWALRKPGHLSGLQRELHGRGAAAAVSVL